MTDLNKPVTRKTITMIRDRGRLRNLVVALFPNGTIGTRPERARKWEITTLESVYSLAVKQRIAKERADKKAAKRAKYGR